jgi:hypothetical protein
VVKNRTRKIGPTMPNTNTTSWIWTYRQNVCIADLLVARTDA